MKFQDDISNEWTETCMHEQAETNMLSNFFFKVGSIKNHSKMNNISSIISLW